MGTAKSSYYYKSCLQICLALPCIAADCHPRPFLRMVLDSCADFMKSLANYTPNALPAAELRPQDRWHLRAPGGGVLPGQGRDPPGAQAFAPKADEAQARQRGRCTPSASAAGSRGGQTRGEQKVRKYRQACRLDSVAIQNRTPPIARGLVGHLPCRLFQGFICHAVSSNAAISVAATEGYGASLC